MYQARVIYVGQSPAVLEWLCLHPRLNVLGAYCPPSAAQRAALLTCALHHEVPLSWAQSSEELEGSLPDALDLAVCAFFERISDRLLRRPRLGWLNLHPAPLPERPGRYPTVEGVLAGDPSWGATLHWMTEALDGGPIIDVARSPRSWLDGPVELEERGVRLGIALLERHLDSIIDGYSSSVAQEEAPKRRASTRLLPTLDLTRGPLKAWRAVRASEPFGGLPMRAGERLVLIKEARLTPITGQGTTALPTGVGWSVLQRWSDPSAPRCALEGRLEGAWVGPQPVQSSQLATLTWASWTLPEGERLACLSRAERELFTYEQRVAR